MQTKETTLNATRKCVIAAVVVAASMAAGALEALVIGALEALVIAALKPRPPAPRPP